MLVSELFGFLQETLHMHRENVSPDDSEKGLETGTCGSNVNEETKQIEGRGPIAKESLLKNWPLMSSIIVYCVFSLHDMAYTEVSLIYFFYMIYLYFAVYCLSIIMFLLIKYSCILIVH
jgi:hypothetical protein